jgi:phospholipase/carboxylesterase
MSVSVESFIHVFEPSPTGVPAGDSETLLLLHGTGGNEQDLLSLGRRLSPGANILSPRGKVLENGMPRFFRRLAEGVFDLEDLRFRTHELADWLAAASDHYGFNAGKVTALGFSNGANISASLLLLRPEAISGAIMYRAMVPFEPETLPNLTGKRILLSEGKQDPLVPIQNAERLQAILKQAGADVTLAWRNAGHNLVRDDLEGAEEWLSLQPSI